MTVKFTQDPSEILDYTLDWTALLVEGDSLAAVIFLPDSGLNLLSQDFTNEGTLWWLQANNTNRSIATVWLYGGNVGSLYNVSCHITTVAGRQENRTFQIKIQEK